MTTLPLHHLPSPRAPMPFLVPPTDVVMPFTRGMAGHASVHETATRQQVARRVAQLKGSGLSEELMQSLWPSRVYLVPSDTLVGVAHAHSLGVHGEDDLLGGVVPHAFVATKAITHPLVAPGAAAPEGWNPAFAEAVAHAVLPGFSAFALDDALAAGRQLLKQGPVRVKIVAQTGGRGQWVARDTNELAAALARWNAAPSRDHGVVLEHNLADVETLSVGQVRVAGLLASYHGRQMLTPDNRGTMAYGGSVLTVVRGGFDALLATLPPGPERRAVEQALAYDAAVKPCFPGFFASRLNYDIAQGRDASGQWRSGVLEQSWRIGGATPAEITALEAFNADPALRRVQATCVEAFGPGGALPPEAVLYFQGDDPEVGPITKYAIAHPDGHAA